MENCDEDKAKKRRALFHSKGVTYFDKKTEMDKEFTVHDVRIVVDQMSLMYLVGTEIDYVEGLAGAGFKFNNPNVKSTCGCGSSFGV